MQRVNYNEIALLYDEPLRDHAVDPHLLTFFDAHPELAPAEARILDIGCGTGKQLTATRGRFPDMAMVGVERFVAVMRAAGFVNVRAHREFHWTREALQDFLVYASQRHRTSQCMVISDADYHAGLQRLEQVIAKAQGQQLVVDSEFCLVTII